MGTRATQARPARSAGPARRSSEGTWSVRTGRQPVRSVGQVSNPRTCSGLASIPIEQRTLGSLSEARGRVRLDAMWSWQRLEGRPGVSETSGEQTERSGVRPTRVMLVDDHDIVRDGIRALLERAEDVVVCAEAATMRQAVNQADRSLPDVVVMDVRLPDGSGIEATREIRAAHPDVRVLMLTSFADDQALFASILAGAAGYVLKQINGEDSLRAVRTVARGESLLDAAVTSRVLERLRTGKHLLRDERLARLSPQEERILQLVADGLTNRQIGVQLGLAEKTVKNYMSSVLSKLRVGRRAEAAAYLARHEDAPELQRLFEGLSGESRYLRFFSGAVDVPLVVHWAADVDYQQRDGLVALTGADGRIVAHVGWERERDRPERAEIALVIDDGFQGRGLGTIMLGQLAESARVQGVELFIAEVLPGNHRMLRVFRDSGFSVRTRSLPGVIMAEMPTELTPDALRRFEDREERASAAAMRRVLAPRSVAVIGASRRRGTVGGELFHNLLAAGFAGPVYPVNPKATSVQSVAAYPTVDEVPGPVDLAVLAVPAAAVVPVARACAAKGVGALVVLSAGFAESGPEGVERQRDLLAVCRQAGMRLVGPNCLGVINTNPAVGLDATFGPTLPARGRVGFGSQSGALGLAIVDYANDLGLGLSSFVAMGNKADVSGND